MDGTFGPVKNLPGCAGVAAQAAVKATLILCLLADGEKSVGDLEILLAQRQSTVSQQLARLRLDGLVESRRDGKSISYSLASDDVRIILDAVHLVFCQQPRRSRRAEGNAAG